MWESAKRCARLGPEEDFEKLGSKKFERIADSEFRKLFEDVQQLASNLEININVQDYVVIEKENWPNPPTKDPDSYYRISIFLLCLDDILPSLNARFLDAETTLQYLIPQYCDVSYNEYEEAFTFY